MKSLPISVARSLVRRDKPVVSRKVKYKDKSYLYIVVVLHPDDVNRLRNVDGNAASFIGNITDGDDSFEMNMTSMPIKEVRALLEEFPAVGMLSVAKGATEDGTKKYVGVTAMAMKSPDQQDAVLRTMLTAASETVVKKRDSQKNKLYSWESKFFARAMRTDSNWKSSNSAKLKKIALKIMKHFDIPTNKVMIASTKTKSAKMLGVTQSYHDDLLSGKPNFAVVNVFDATVDTLIHEMAHLVCNFTYKRGETSGHGPEFCGMYAHILGLFGTFEEDDVIASMAKFGLKCTKVKRKIRPEDEIEL